MITNQDTPRLVKIPNRLHLEVLGITSYMWPKNFKDYPTDSPLKKEQVESGKGIIGCEMHEQMGWGHEHDRPNRPKKGGFFRSFYTRLFGEHK